MDVPKKECTICHIIKPSNEFSKDAKKVDGLSYMCRSCMKNYRKQQHKKYSHCEREAIIPDTKICPSCDRQLASNLFCKNKSRHDGLDSMCKECKSRYNKERYLNSRLNNAESNQTHIQCRKCQQLLPLSEFPTNYNKKNNKERLCKQCMKIYQRSVRSEIILKNREAVKATEKTCSNCKNNLPIEMFSKNSNKRGGYENQCKNCASLLQKKYYETQEGKLTWKRKSHKRRICEEQAGEVSLTLEQWQLCLQEVNYHCPMCGKPFSSERPATIDHIFPVSKGGALTYWNTQALCGSCNSSKCDSIRIDHEIRKAQTIALRLRSFLK